MTKKVKLGHAKRGGLAGYTKAQFAHWLRRTRATAQCGDADFCVLAQFLREVAGIDNPGVGDTYNVPNPKYDPDWEDPNSETSDEYIERPVPAWGERVIHVFDAMEDSDNGGELSPEQYRPAVLRVL